MIPDFTMLAEHLLFGGSSSGADRRNFIAKELEHLWRKWSAQPVIKCEKHGMNMIHTHMYCPECEVEEPTKP